MTSNWNGHLRRNMAVIARLRKRNPNVLSKEANAKIVRERMVERMVRSRFETEGGSTGMRWKALKPSTVSQRRRQGFAPGPVLVRSGTLMKAAVTGREKPTRTGIVKRMRNTQGPAYAGRSAPKALSVYAGALNQERPFYNNPSQRESRDIVRRFNMITDREFVRMID